MSIWSLEFCDSSIIYDFDTDVISFCDIDLFRKAPTHNDLGKEYYVLKD